MMAAAAVLALSAAAAGPGLGAAPRGAPPKPAPAAPAATAPADPDSTAPSSGSDTSAVRPPELFLSWRGPHGTARARTDVPLRGGEAAQPETLYLSFDPGRDAETLYGMSAVLRFRVPVGDTLGSLWRFGGGTMNKRNVQIEFPHDDSWGAPRPFRAAGFGAPHYQADSEGGQLQIIYAVPVEGAAPIRTGRRYCLARVIFPAGSTFDEGDGQPVCLEWVRSDLGFALEGAGSSVWGRTGERFVSVNSPGVVICGSFRRAPDAWAPEGQKPD